MPKEERRRLTKKAAGSEPVAPPEEPLDPASPFDAGLLENMRKIAGSGLNPSSALDLLGRLIAEIPSASKETLDRIKTMDKLINTARSMMDTKLKNEEAAAITQRLNEIELEMDRIAARSAGPGPSDEIWDKREVDE
ncbi:MAG: hypothetical protein P8182_12395 [Deltaproteobacteria bacterium]